MQINNMPARTEYWIDQADVLFQVNDGWSEFALENGAPHLLPAHVLGRSLWAFLDRETETLYRRLFQGVRSTQRVLRLGLRCDSFTVRRQMQLTITAAADQVLHLACETTGAPISYSGASRQRISGPLYLCSWCNRVRLFHGEWVNIEEAMPSLLDQTPPPQISHGTCSECAAMLELHCRELEGEGAVPAGGALGCFRVAPASCLGR